jgi:hypothetical protein
MSKSYALIQARSATISFPNLITGDVRGGQQGWRRRCRIPLRGIKRDPHRLGHPGLDPPLVELILRVPCIVFGHRLFRWECSPRRSEVRCCCDWVVFCCLIPINLIILRPDRLYFGWWGGFVDDAVRFRHLRRVDQLPQDPQEW